MKYLALLSLSLLSLAGFAADGPIAEWLFDDGTGTTAADTTGNGHDAILHGATFAKVGDGFALSLDGTDDYVDCTAAGSLPISGPVAISAWIMPTRAGNGEAVLMGDGMRTFLMTYYNTNLCFLYIGNGGNHVKDYLALHRWQHVAASFDGERMALWLNGRQVAGRESGVKAFEPSGNFMIGNPGPDDLPRFKGFIDNVRVYNRGLTDDDVIEVVRTEAADYGMGIANIDSGDAGTATAFFHEHPNPIDIKESDKTILFANRKVGLAFVRTDHGFQLLRLSEIGGADSGFIRGGSCHIAGAIHTVSLAQAMFGNGIEEVRCTGPKDLGIVFLSLGERDDRPRSGVVLHHAVKEYYHCASHVSAYGKDGAILQKNNINDWNFPYGAAHILRLVRHMVKTGEVDDTMSDMIEAVAVVNAARLSQQNGSRPVQLTEITRD